MICFRTIKNMKEVGGVKIKGLNDDDRFDEDEQGNCTSLKFQSGSAALKLENPTTDLATGFRVRHPAYREKDGREMWRG
jgi:hypothetical protein